MKKDIVLNIKTQFENAQTIQELEDTLENINVELEEIDENSKAFQDLTSFADKATAEIDQLNHKVADLNGQSGKMKDGVDSLRSTTEMYSSANSELASSFDKVAENGGAIAVLDSLTGGMATRIRDAVEASKLFNVSLKGMRTALIATGIGAFVVALGLVVGYWDRIKDAILQTTQRLHDKIDALRESKELTLLELDALDKQAELNELNGVSNVEITAEKRKQLEILQGQTKEEIKSLETLLMKEIARQKEYTLAERLKVLAISMVNSGAAAVEKEMSKLAIGGDILEIQKQLKQIKNEELDIDIRLAQLNAKKKTEKQAEVKAAKELKQIEDSDEELEDDLEISEEEAIEEGEEIKLLTREEYWAKNLQGESEYLRKRFEMAVESGEALVDFEQWKADKLIEMEEQVYDMKIKAAMTGMAAISDLLDSFAIKDEKRAEQVFKVQKGIAIAQAILDTYSSVRSVYKAAAASPITTAFPAYPFIMAGSALASGLADVNRIKNQQFQSTSISSTSGGGGGGQTPTANVTPIIPTFSTENQEQKIKVFVTETDIRNSSERVSGIYNRAVVTE